MGQAKRNKESGILKKEDEVHPLDPDHLKIQRNRNQKVHQTSVLTKGEGMGKISHYISKKDGVQIKENYIRTFGASAWDKLQARAKELQELETTNHEMISPMLFMKSAIENILHVIPHARSSRKTKGHCTRKSRSKKTGDVIASKMVMKCSNSSDRNRRNREAIPGLPDVPALMRQKNN